MCPEHQVGWLCICNPCKDQWRSCGAALTPQVMGEGFRDRSHGATMPGSVGVCRRGLSRYFQGKSQSFTSLSDVRFIEDLAKEETPYRKRVKTWRRPCFTPGPRRKSLAKKASRGPCASSLARSSSSNLLRSGKPPT
ncbi:hypothetical protein BHE74_00022524 [Ensete ventricosum]|nr:hypothetical protein BHE74_00022524 [Ensete ventricosum]